MTEIVCSRCDIWEPLDRTCFVLSFGICDVMVVTLEEMLPLILYEWLSRKGPRRKHIYAMFQMKWINNCKSIILNQDTNWCSILIQKMSSI